MTSSIERQRRTNWINSIDNVVDSYPLGLAHGLQKDAIQNGWDACATKTKAYVSSNWRMLFKIVKSEGVTYLIIQDIGTTGLSGDKVADDFSEDEIPPEEERWAKWESFASGKTSDDTLGERGQGKVLYLAASKDYSIYYDSLRENGTYRAGWSKATHSSSPLRHWDEDEGREEIQRLGLPDLTETGSRFIIVNPREAIIDSINSGSFTSYISDTWWPIILKYGARIEIDSSHHKHFTKTPDKYPIDKTQIRDGGCKVWVNNEVKVTYMRNAYKIKRVAFYYDPNGIEDDKHGVGVYRAGMRIPTLSFSRRDFEDKVYGYVELGDAIDQELKSQKLEFPNHYGFKPKGLWRKVEQVIIDEMEAFVNTELVSGLSDEQKKRSHRTAAQNKALAVLKGITQGWQLYGGGSGLGGDDPTGQTDIRKQGLRMHDFIFPNANNIPRLNYGESVNSFFLTGFNKKDKPLSAEYMVNLLSGDRLIKTIAKGEAEIGAHSHSALGGKQTIIATKDLFPEAGEYRLRATLSDHSSTKKTNLHAITRKIWVEQDPQLNAPFDIEGISFAGLEEAGISPKAEWYLSNEGSNKFTLYYNIDHPTYLISEPDDSGQARYLSEIFSAGALELLIHRIKSSGEEEIKNKDTLPITVEVLLSDDPEAIYRETVLAMSKIKHEIDEEI
jgi:hypothetical protein